MQFVNFTYRRSGTLWEGRYKAVPIDRDGYLMTCYRYIEANPVRAGMVTHPGGYRWSSYPHNANGKADALIHPHALYRELGPDDQTRCAVYRKLFREEVGDADLSAIRESVNKGWVLGSERFAKKIAAVTQRRVAPLARGGRRKGAGRRSGSRAWRKVNRVSETLLNARVGRLGVVRSPGGVNENARDPTDRNKPDNQKRNLIRVYHLAPCEHQTRSFQVRLSLSPARE